MSIGQRIRERRNDLNLSREDLAVLLGISASAISNYENDLNTPKTDVMYLIFDALKCDANYLFQDFINGVYDYDLTLNEQRMFRRYRKLDDRSREIVDAMLNSVFELESKRVKAEESPVYTPSRYIELYYMPVSAGAGIDLDDGYSEPIEIPLTDTSERADFALRVSGDSMEPEFHNGDLLLVASKPADDGELGIFIYNNAGYFKKLVKSEMHSLNPKYAPIRINDVDAFYNKGTVIGKV